MALLNSHYRTPLLTDLYQLTMAAGYWKSGKGEQDSVFHLFFRTIPFSGGYAIAAGLADAVAWLKDFRFDESDLEYLSAITGRDGKPLFEKEFIDYLGNLEWTCDVDAIAEGTPVFAHEPIVRVKGPLIQAQLVETALLNIINFQTLIATKSARICQSAKGEPVLEFGLRRAQGPDGGIMAARAAFIGGCVATSNVLAGKILEIPVRGTHAHSWVMSFDTEEEAFDTYAEAQPNNCIFLVDTYDTLDGVKRAVETGKKLREKGHEMVGIRLDSGDLAWLSIEARRILDEGGFPDAVIVASNDLDEFTIQSLKHQGAKITVWGVGTRLVTGGSQPALGGVYKLGAIREEDGKWDPRMKLSEQTAKISNPGILQVRRFEEGEKIIGDAIFDEEAGCPEEVVIVDPGESVRRKKIAPGTDFSDLLEPVFRDGKFIGSDPSLEEIQSACRAQLKKLHPTILRLESPHRYPAGLELGLHQEKQRRIEAMNQNAKQ